MKGLIHLRYFSLFVLLFIQTISFSKVTQIIIPNDIFESVLSIQNIQIIDYPGDTNMVYVDLTTLDTSSVYCKGKELAESYSKIMKEKHGRDNIWEGTYPQICEKVTLVRHSSDNRQFLLAREQEGFYRFWNPRSMPFANSVFFISTNSIYLPVETCVDLDKGDPDIACSDGFLMSEADFMKKWDECH